MNTTSTTPLRQLTTGALRRAAMSLAAIALAVVGCLVTTVGPASAGPPPVQIDDCGFGFSDSQPTSTTVRFTIRGTCDHLIAGMGHYLTLERSGNVVAKPHKECANTSGALPFTCRFTYTLSDPAGSQRFEVHDEFRIYGSIYHTVTLKGLRSWSFTS